jgi:hypothetical protein
MSEVISDLRSELRTRFKVLGDNYIEAKSRYEENREKLDREYTTTLADLNRECAVLKEMLQIEEKRFGPLRENGGNGKVAQLVDLTALEKAVAPDCHPKLPLSAALRPALR